MSTEKQLLQDAARAAGMWPEAFSLGDDDQPEYFDGQGFYLAWGKGFWNPLTDDGDALRLAVTLGLSVDCSRPSAGVPFQIHRYEQDDFKDPLAATRRAIVRAAAAIGRGE